MHLVNATMPDEVKRGRSFESIIILNYPLLSEEKPSVFNGFKVIAALWAELQAKDAPPVMSFPKL